MCASMNICWYLCADKYAFWRLSFFLLQRTIKAMEQSWHEECFVCGGPCKKPLVGTSFYERDGRPYCRVDFEQLFAARCAGCSQPITENAIVALNAKWHRDCFKCKVSAHTHTCEHIQ